MTDSKTKEAISQYRGGVLMIGSLFWDPSEIRHNWRSRHLKPLETAIDVQIPIRYGRISKSRDDTFTMVFSKEIEGGESMGRGKFLEFHGNPKSPEELINEGLELIKAECNTTELNFSVFNWSWGTIGIGLNPKTAISDKSGFGPFIEHWSNQYGRRKPLDPDEYKVGQENRVITPSGILEIVWPRELTEIDYFITTLTKSGLTNYPSAEEIAKAMHDAKDRTYFENNVKYGILTFQDEQIETVFNDLSEPQS
ncbi:hypothetical protein [Flagellimonas nanhaiensis]|uniref:Uncharacterized protein n=1 Tax=Flagellimonas nanhaiensis TaxID=2292706 RepID=A0A371JRR8_9FLAO|nr:hypothetical protein [Allomuricauda nanhaiensis]RDY60210.1 hypothetical protein DX873_12860 [Allomuricauda nanhaiensis]